MPKPILSLIVAVAASVGLSATARADQFYAFLVEAGGYSPCCTIGAPITVSQGHFYQHPQGDNHPPQTWQIDSHPDLQWDSYVALGGSPSSPTVDGQAPWMGVKAGATWGHFAGTDEAIDNSVNGNTLQHLWFARPPQAAPILGGPPAASSTGPGGYQAVFVARLTVQRDAEIVSTKVFFSVRTPGGELAAFVGKVDGGVNFHKIYMDDEPIPGEFYRLKSYRAAQPDLPGFGPADVYDLYIERVPLKPPGLYLPPPLPTPPPAESRVTGPTSLPLLDEPQTADPKARKDKQAKAPKPAKVKAPKAPKAKKNNKATPAPQFPQWLDDLDTVYTTNADTRPDPFEHFWMGIPHPLMMLEPQD